MMYNIDYVTMYKTFLNLRDSENDLDVLEDLSDNLEELEKVSKLESLGLRQMVTDDTTLIHATKAVSTAKSIVAVATPLVDDFLGISREERKELVNLLPEFLVSYGIVLYKTFGYEIIADHYSTTNTIDTSKITLPSELLDKVTEDLSSVIDTINTILIVFQTFKAYFAEYQISDSQDLYDVIAELEDRDFGTEAIGRLTEEEVKDFLAKGGYN